MRYRNDIYIYNVLFYHFYMLNISKTGLQRIAVRQSLRRELGRAAGRRGLLLQQVQAGGGTMGGQFAPLEWWFYPLVMTNIAIENGHL